MMFCGKGSISTCKSLTSKQSLKAIQYQNFLPYAQLAPEINKIDIGKLSNLTSLCSGYDKIAGAYREPVNITR